MQYLNALHWRCLTSPVPVWLVKWDLVMFSYTQSGQRTSVVFKFSQITSAQCYLQTHSDAVAANGSNIRRRKVGDFAKSRLKTLLVCTTKD